jgi:hypothetical protein
MSKGALTRNLALLCGIPAFAVGVILCLQMNQIWESHLGLAALNSIVLTTLFLTTAGPIAALVGAVIWARAASVAYVTLSGALSGLSALGLYETLNAANVHDSRMMLVPGF